MAATTNAVNNPRTGLVVKTVWVAWLVAAFFYFYQYVQRSAPSVMMPQLGDTFGLTAAAILRAFKG